MARTKVTAPQISGIILSHVENSSTQTGLSSTETALTGLSITYTVPTGGQRLRVKFQIPLWNTTGGSADQWRFFIKEGSTVLKAITDSPAAAFGHTVLGEAVYTATAGAKTYTVTVQRMNGTGSGSTNIVANYETTMTLEAA